TFHPDDRPRAIGAWSGLGGVAAAVGPFLGGWIAGTAGWRWIFLLNLPVAAAVVTVTARHVPEASNPTARGRVDVAGAGLAAPAVAGIAGALIEAPGRGIAGAGATGAVGVAAGAAFVALEHRRARPGSRAGPMLPLDVFASRQFTAVNLVTFLV